MPAVAQTILSSMGDWEIPIKALLPRLQAAQEDIVKSYVVTNDRTVEATTSLLLFILNGYFDILPSRLVIDLISQKIDKAKADGESSFELERMRGDQVLRLSKVLLKFNSDAIDHFVPLINAARRELSIESDAAIITAIFEKQREMIRQRVENMESCFIEVFKAAGF